MVHTMLFYFDAEINMKTKLQAEQNNRNIVSYDKTQEATCMNPPTRSH